MKKVLKKEELTVQSDLSEASLEAAGEQLVQQKDCLPAGMGNFTYYVLRVASQNMGTAVVLRVHAAILIDIDFLYEPDEWSLHCFEFKKEDSYIQYEYVVHTKGA